MKIFVVANFMRICRIKVENDRIEACGTTLFIAEESANIVMSEKRDL